MRARSLILPLLAAGLVLAGPPQAASVAVAAPLGGDDDLKAPNNPNDPLPLRVNDAINSGVEWLKRYQWHAGNFGDKIEGDRLYDPNATGEPYKHPAGPTALALYTLLKSGVQPNDPVIKKGFDWLRKNAGLVTSGGFAQGAKGDVKIPRGSYEISTTILALEAHYNPHKRAKDLIKELERESRKTKRGRKLTKTKLKMDAQDEAWMKQLLSELRKRQTKGSGWRYDVNSGNGYHRGARGDNDMSSTQLAMMAFLAGERAGIEQPDSFYLDMLKWTLEQQFEDGPEVERWDPMKRDTDDEYGGSAATMDKARGWGYMKRSSEEREMRPTSSMTACGLANVLICSQILSQRKNDTFEKQWADKAERAWHDGVAWFQEHWDMSRNVNSGGSYHYYALYCIERVGDLKGVNLIAGRPWYNEGAEVLVNEQHPGGRWEKKGTHRPYDLLNTCFALLFLNRSTPAITAD